MKLSNEDFIANSLLTTLNEKYDLNKNRQATIIPGESIVNSLNQKYQTVYQDCLTGTIKQLQKYTNQKNLDIKPFNKINEQTLYYTIFDKSNEQLIAMIPFSQLITELSLMYLVPPKQKKPLTTEELNKIQTNTIQNIVFGEILRYTNNEKQLESSIINSIEYKGLESNPYNIVIKFTLPIKKIKEPLRSVIQDSIKKDSPIDYKKITKPTLKVLELAKDKEHINFVVSLYK